MNSQGEKKLFQLEYDKPCLVFKDDEKLQRSTPNKGPFHILRKRGFFYQPEHFHKFFEHFSSLCAKYFKLKN